ncbi:MAG: YkvA family protein [Bacteroidales bacterium]
MKHFPSKFLAEGKRYFSEAKFWAKIRRYSRKAGLQVVYAALLLYFLMQSRTVPMRAKAGIMAALGYFVLPTDLIPDVVIAFGFTDDIAVLLYALSQVSDHITPEVKEKARVKLTQWFENIDPVEIALLEEKISGEETDTL